MVMVEFNGNSLFQKALKDAFEVFINKESASKFSNAELISTFCDRLLKGGMYVHLQRCTCWHVCVFACLFVCLFVCMYVRTYACTYVSTYACTYVCICMYVCMHVCMYVCMYVSLHVCMHVCKFAYMYACMHVCMYVCMYGGCSERMDDAATEDALEKVVQLFSFLTDKDLFGEIYRCCDVCIV